MFNFCLSFVDNFFLFIKTFKILFLYSVPKETEKICQERLANLRREISEFSGLHFPNDQGKNIYDQVLDVINEISDTLEVSSKKFLQNQNWIGKEKPNVFKRFTQAMYKQKKT